MYPRTQNAACGFFGAIEAHDFDPESIWQEAVEAITTIGTTSINDAVVFLDSKYGRKFADDVLNALHRKSEHPVADAVILWSCWKFPKSLARSHGITCRDYLDGCIQLAKH